MLGPSPQKYLFILIVVQAAGCMDLQCGPHIFEVFKDANSVRLQLKGTLIVLQGGDDANERVDVDHKSPTWIAYCDSQCEPLGWDFTCSQLREGIRE